MTREEIIRMAQEAGVTFVTDFGVASATPEWLERFAALAIAAEREACANECDEWIKNGSTLAEDIADAIRARGEK